MTKSFPPQVFPSYPNQNSQVTVQDIQATVQAFSQRDDGLQPYDPWYYAWYDLNGSGAVTVTDINMVVAGYARKCYAGAPI